MSGRAATLLILFWGLAVSASAAAQGPASQTRCAVTGPLAISAYTAFLNDAGSGDRHGTGRQAQNASSLIVLYEKLGCPVPALRSAIECITSGLLGTAGSAQSASQSAGQITTSDAEACMRAAGMTIR